MCLLLTDAVVGFERMFYNVTEDVGMVEVCTVVHRPQLACPISFPFILSFDTRDGSARESILTYVTLCNS